MIKLLFTTVVFAAGLAAFLPSNAAAYESSILIGNATSGQIGLTRYPTTRKIVSYQGRVWYFYTNSNGYFVYTTTAATGNFMPEQLAFSNSGGLSAFASIFQRDGDIFVMCPPSGYNGAITVRRGVLDPTLATGSNGITWGTAISAVNSVVFSSEAYSGDTDANMVGGVYVNGNGLVAVGGGHVVRTNSFYGFIGSYMTLNTGNQEMTYTDSDFAYADTTSDSGGVPTQELATVVRDGTTAGNFITAFRSGGTNNPNLTLRSYAFGTLGEGAAASGA
ncbi:MAG: hypothetical protein NTY45_01315, partial [Elusimicrobia bacterium]|nr:hypothetical protein [Elusimicrobiota bacterium]